MNRDRNFDAILPRGQKRFIEGEDRTQITLLPECLDDYVAEDTRSASSRSSLTNSTSAASASKVLTPRPLVDQRTPRPCY
jgi:hypothetical protein